jgi:hypothetical protein
MRINDGQCTESARPYNEVYDAYKPLFLKILSQRPVHLDPEFTKAYVSMPQAEKDLMDFVKSGCTEIGLLEGSIGIGKSSVLSYLSRTHWSENGNTGIP